MSLTSKQMKIMTVVCAGSPAEDEEWCDIDQVLEQLECVFKWKTTKQSLQFSLRALKKHDLINKDDTENRRGRRRRIIKPTSFGVRIAGPRRDLPGSENSSA